MPFRHLLGAAVLAVCAVAPAVAAAPSSVYVEDLTWTELRAQLQAGKTTLIVPVGGTEQSGPHMALGKHNVRAKVLAGRIAAGLGNALVAPVIAYVPEGAVHPPTGHMRFSGTITLPDSVFESTLEYAARSFREHGFRDIVLIGDHGGYQQSLARVAAKLNREWSGGPTHVHAVLDYYRAVDTDYVQALKRQGFRDDEIGTHAGLADTALMLAIDPQFVRTEALQRGSGLGPGEGVHGDPRRATAAVGQVGVDLIVSRASEAIKRDVARR